MLGQRPIASAALASRFGGLTTIALVAASRAMTAGRGAMQGVTHITARGSTVATGRGLLLSVKFLQARSAAMATGRAAASFKGSLSARGAAIAQSLTIITGKTTLSARGSAMASGRGNFVNALGDVAVWFDFRQGHFSPLSSSLGHVPSRRIGKRNNCEHQKDCRNGRHSKHDAPFT